MLKERSEDNINTVTRVIWKFSARETLYCLEKFRGKILGVGREEEYAGLCCCSSSVISGAKLKSGRRRRSMLYSDILHLSGNNLEKHAEEGTNQQV